jgi:hypothetical protein
MPDEIRLTATGEPDRVARFVRAIGRRKGLRVSQDASGATLFLDASRIERLGPAVEAKSIASDVRLHLADLDATMPSAGLDARPSALWLAISVAADERAVARERGIEPVHGLFDYVRLDQTDDGLLAFSGLPGRDAAISLPPDMNPTKFDDADWHRGAAEEAGQPEENASTHMSLYLTWLIRHDLIGPGWLRPGQLVAVKAGALAGRHVLRSMDDKLISDTMQNGGADFSTDCYAKYLEAYGAAFVDEPDYSIRCDTNAYERIEPAIDRLWADWLSERDGR